MYTTILLALFFVVAVSALFMADAKSNYLETKVIDHVLGKGARNFTSPANLFLSLHTADPSDDGSGTELAGNGYARQAVSFSAGSGGSTENTALITFGPCTGSNWGSVTHAAVWDASSAGNMLYYGALTTPRTINVGDRLEFAAGEFDISEL